MARQTLLGLTALLFCLAFVTEYAAARPSSAPGERRPGLRVATGNAHSCAIREDGTVLCWGDNQFGQLGDGTTTDQLTPVTVSGLQNVISIAAGLDHTCALLATGFVRCWGANTQGRLGDGTTTNRSTSVQVHGVINAIAVAAGSSHTCALIAGGTVRCWGANSDGQLGDGTKTDRATAVNALLFDSFGTQILLESIVELAAGGNHSCALTVAGAVFCWGDNTLGQLGDGTMIDRTVATSVGGLSNVVGIAAGNANSCALSADGSVRCWGQNIFGQLGDGTTTSRPTPALVTGLPVPPFATASTISSGANHSCVVLANHVSRCWGRNVFGQLGDGTTTDRTAPIGVAGLGTVISISGGAAHTCALIVDDSVRCWGMNDQGQLGNNSQINASTSVAVQGAGAAAIAARRIAAGSTHTCALRANGSVSCWGRNSEGQIGDGTTTNALVPTLIVGISAIGIAAGDSHTCSLFVSGVNVCWGDNSDGQLGDGTFVGRNSPFPLNPVLPLDGFAVSIVARSNNTCAVVGGGTAHCWGDTNPIPSQVGGLNVVAIAPGTSHKCELIATGRVSCVGSNDSGQLGDGTTINRLSPVAVSGLTDAIAVVSGGRFSCALVVGGSVRCWGVNESGQLGDGTTTTRLTPVDVAGLTNVVAIGAGSSHVCAIIASGLLRCWGNNIHGELGDGTQTNRLTPVQIPVSSLIAVAAGSTHTCALRADGLPFCWGKNLFGEIGRLGIPLINTTPVDVPSFSFNIDPNVTITRDGKKAEVIALANCEAGAQARIHVELRQGDNVGQEQVTVECTGALERYPVIINTHGRDHFATGAAQATADTVVLKRRAVIETQEWTRAITIRVGSLREGDD